MIAIEFHSFDLVLFSNLIKNDYHKISYLLIGLTWLVLIRSLFSTAAGVPGTGVGSRWLECLTPKPHTSLFSGWMLRPGIFNSNSSSGARNHHTCMKRSV